MITANQALRPLLESKLPPDIKWGDLKLLKCSKRKEPAIYLFQHKDGFKITMKVIEPEIHIKTTKRFDVEKMKNILSKETALAFLIIAISRTPEGETSNDSLWNVPRNAAHLIAQAFLSYNSPYYNPLQKTVFAIIDKYDEKYNFEDKIEIWGETYDCDIYTCTRLSKAGRSVRKWANDLTDTFYKENKQKKYTELIKEQ